jgi:uncharacterized protein YdhG (YjbR/CyaY superfamily)
VVQLHRVTLRSLRPVFDGPRQPVWSATEELGVPTRSRTVEQYLASLTADNRAALERVRRAIRAAAPKAEECMSYGMPAFRLNGKLIAGFRAAANHCSFHPMSGDTVTTLKKDLAKYDTSRGTIRFSASAGLPVTLIQKLVRTRIAESE